MTKATCWIAAVVACLLAALSGCGAPFFVAEADLRSVLGKEYLYAGTTAGIQAFDVDVETGRVTTLAGSPFGATCAGMLTSTPDGRNLYGMSLLSDPVYGFQILEDGTLSSTAGFPLLPTDGVTTFYSARSMAVRPDGRFAYATHGGSTDALTSYSVDSETGALTFLSGLAVGCAPSATAIDPGGSHLYVARANPSAILHLPIGNGPAVTQSVAASPSVAAASMVIHPDGYLYGMSSGGTDKNILAYRIDPDSGSLSAVSGSPYRLGFGPANVGGIGLAVDRFGSWLYATATDDRLYRYRINQSSGALTLVEGLGTANGGRVSASSSGRYVFVAGDDHFATGLMHVYEVTRGGALSEIPGSPFPFPGGPTRDVRAVNTLRLP